MSSLELSPTQVEIQTEALGLSAEEVEQLITVPLEADLLNGVAFLDDDSVERRCRALVDRAWSSSRAPTCWTARQVVQERMTQAHALPNVSKPPVDAAAAVVDEPRHDGRARRPTGCR